MRFSELEGEIAVRLARDALEAAVRGKKLRPRSIPETFRKELGVFTTLSTFPALNLRGCIGYPLPSMPLGKAIIRSAVSAAQRDPRFPRVHVDELDHLVVEVSLMTEPELIEVSSSAEYPRKIELGKDGLILEDAHGTGLLLPQVPVEHNWGVMRYLKGICEKAGLGGNYWKSGDIKLYKFQAEIFHEMAPGGDVKRKLL